MTKSELIHRLAENAYLPHGDVELAVKMLLKCMCQSLESEERIEIRDFGSFNLSYRAGRVGRNPRTSEEIIVPGKQVLRFKPSEGLLRRVNPKSWQRRGPGYEVSEIRE